MISELTAERLRQLVSYDPETGVFIKLVAPHAGKPFGTPHYKRGYINMWVDGYLRAAHRLAWLYMTGEWPRHVIDHIDGNPANNKFSNLRDVTQEVNCQNQRAPTRRSLSGVLGVTHPSRHTQLYRARIRANGRVLDLGYYSTSDEAHEAYMKAKRALHAGCTV